MSGAGVRERSRRAKGVSMGLQKDARRGVVPRQVMLLVEVWTGLPLEGRV